MAKSYTYNKNILVFVQNFAYYIRNEIPKLNKLK